MKKLIISAIAISFVAIVGAFLSTNVNAGTNSGGCLDPNDPRSFDASITTRSTGTIWTRDGRPLCSDAKMTLASMNVPDTWDRKGWNKTAIPQTLYADTEFTFPGGIKDHKMTVKVNAVDECKNTQTDFYVAPSYDRIDTLTGDDGRNVLGVLFKATETCKETPKTISVCDLKTYTIITIKESEFDAKKHSKDTANCKKPVENCEIPGKEDLPKDDPNCVVTPVTPIVPKPPVTPPEPPTVKPTEPSVLPNTGAGNVASIFIAASTLAAGAHHLLSRRLRSNE